MFGAIGLPLKISRTVVIGKKADVVKRFLYMLSYFIRCSDIHETTDLDCLNNLLSPDSLEASLTLSNELTASYTSQESSLYPNSSRSGSSLSGSTLKSDHAKYAYSQRDSNDFLNLHVLSSHDMNDLAKSGSAKPLISNSENEHCKCTINSIDSDCNAKSCNFVCNDCRKLRKNKDKNRMRQKSVPSLSEESERSESSNSNKFSNKICVVCGKGIQSLCQFCVNNSVGCNSRCLKSQTSINLTSCNNENNSSSSDKTVIFNPISVPSEADLTKVTPLQAGSSTVCSLTSFKVVESPTRENVVCVSKGVGKSNFSEEGIKSQLAEQLKSDQSTSSAAEVEKLTDKSNIKKIFLSEGSNSMFEEYFQPGIEAKTIEDIEENVLHSTNSIPKKPQDGNKDSDLNKLPIPQMLRQSSQDFKAYSMRSASFAHLGRSITPTELSRRRHLSSTGSIEYETFDPLNHFKELRMPEQENDLSQWNIKAFDRNFGRSLLAGYTDHYMSDFVLHGTSDSSFKSQLLHDLQMTVQHSILDEPIDEAVCVIADTDNW